MLSIAIPTHNRYPFLKWTLERTRRDFLEAEIVISDNCSTDGTRYLWSDDKNTKITHQKDNIGPFPNLRAALLQGTGRYCVYLGDDDYLVPEAVGTGIKYLEEHPGVVCYYAPCQLYNEVENKPDWNAFYVARDETFHDPGQLWNFIIHSHVWPEHAIWRREGLENIIKPRERAYWCFIDLAHAFAQGPVHFASTPYYRNITAHPVGDRSKLGDRQCLTDFDEYRAGLEILAYELFKGHLTPELKGKLALMIQAFISARIGVAAKLLRAQGRTAEAESYDKRLNVCA